MVVKIFFVNRNRKGYNMKKFLALLFIFSSVVFSQVFDPPIDSTAWYNFRLYDQKDHVPNTILNEDKENIDKTLHSLIVVTDTLQYTMVKDTALTSFIDTNLLVFKVSNYATGYGKFTGTEQADTIIFPVVLTDTTDIILINPFSASVSANDVLSPHPINGTDTLIIYRPASGTSGLDYVWRWIRRY